MLLADVVAASNIVKATRSRTAKVAALAEVIRAAPQDEVGLVVGYLVGSVRQGRIGIGWSTVRAMSDVVPAEDPQLTVRDVDAAIDRVADAVGTGRVAARQAVIGDVFARATEGEADFLRRLLLGDLRQGALEGVMTEAVAAAASVPVASVRRAAMLAGDLCHVAEVALVEGERGLDQFRLQPLRPVLPMLAATSASVAEALGANGRSSVEWKLDGARVQAHREGDTVRLFTRQLNDVTERLPGIVEIIRGLPAHALILDGEVFGAAVDDDRADPFQDTMSRFSRHDNGGGGGTAAELQVRFFDILHLDGDDLIDRPLDERLDALDRLVGPLRIPGVVTDEVGEAERFAEDAVARGHEGVMVKAIGSPYEAGRRGRAWQKVKPVRTFDLVVLAAEWGHGRRQGWLSNLHLGARDEQTGDFLMVGKTFKGLTDALLAWQTEELQKRETGRSGITVHVRPELVVEIALDGVQRSTRYPAGLALRFARVKRYRLDKAADQADTVAALQELLPGS